MNTLPPFRPGLLVEWAVGSSGPGSIITWQAQGVILWLTDDGHAWVCSTVSSNAVPEKKPLVFLSPTQEEIVRHKTLLAAEGHPDGAPSEGWRRNGGEWKKSIYEGEDDEGGYELTVHNGYGTKTWKAPLFIGYDHYAFEGDDPGTVVRGFTTVYEAMVEADKWLADKVKARKNALYAREAANAADLTTSSWRERP
jgi:hypothetical protein